MLQTSDLTLFDITPLLSDSWFTVISTTGEVNNPMTFTYPERFKVVKITNDPTQVGVGVIVNIM